jgi:hypothetical protein
LPTLLQETEIRSHVTGYEVATAKPSANAVITGIGAAAF